ncbi:MAG: hypothetical protein RL755_336 [Pseudomonadota bacterium]|jgi:aspartokinase-like uncharacterized kinase
MRVVKLGGSLFKNTPQNIFACLAHIATQSIPTIVVCGGGEFADCVRHAQRQWHFSDVCAHEMAILAMQQTALMSQTLFPIFTLFTLSQTVPYPDLAIWLPSIEELNSDHVPASWDITSDSLAAWLANKIQATQLLVIKACDVDSNAVIDELAQKGIVDAQLPHFVKNASYNITILSASAFLNL